MKFSILASTFILFTSTSFAQTLTTQVRPADRKEWGYIDLKGNMIIDAKFRKCYEFSEGFAPIYEKKEKSYHFINIKGERLKTDIPQYILIEGFGFGVQGFKDGLTAIRVDDVWGYLNTQGQLAIELKYSDVTNFNGGYASVEKGSDLFIINTKGEETAVTNPKITKIKKFSEGLAPFVDAEKKSGFVNEAGEIVIESQFLSVGYFNNGLAWAKTSDGMVGFINKKGEWAIDAKFASAKEFDKEAGLARVKYQDKWAYVSTTGEIINIDITTKWGDFNEGLAQGRSGDKFGFYNSKGEWVIKPQFQLVRDFKNGYAAAKKDDKWGMINKSGDWVIQPIYGGIKDMEISD